MTIQYKMLYYYALYVFSLAAILSWRAPYFFCTFDIYLYYFIIIIIFLSFLFFLYIIIKSDNTIYNIINNNGQAMVKMIFGEVPVGEGVQATYNSHITRVAP